MPGESKKWSEQGIEAMLNHLLQTPTDYVAPLLDKFGKIAALNPVPFDDHAIRELATLMMSTPTYQLC